MQRKTLNFTESTAAQVAPFLASASADRGALAELSGEELGSESDVLRALVRLGVRAVRDSQLERGYLEMAASRTAEDEEWTQGSMKSAADRWSVEP